MSDTAHAPMSMQEAAALLRWYAELGVDVAVEDTGQDRFAESAHEATPAGIATPARPPAPAQPVAPPVVAPAAAPGLAQSVEDTVAAARAAAAQAQSLDELRGMLEAFEGLALKRTATRLVFASGNPAARVMLVGEAPGRDEDREGEPFVGRAGRLLDLMLAAIGLDRGSVYIANVIPWRPPGNRTPTPQESQVCLPFIRRQIELADPDILVFLGGTAAQTMTGAREGILRMRGKWREHVTASGNAIPAMPTLHPAYLLRTPAHKRLAWRDFLEVKMKLRSPQD